MTQQATRQQPTASDRLNTEPARILYAKLRFLSKYPREYLDERVHCAHVPELRSFMDQCMNRSQSVKDAYYETLHIDLRAMELQGYLEVDRRRWDRPPRVRLSEAGRVTLELLEEVLG